MFNSLILLHRCKSLSINSSVLQATLGDTMFQAINIWSVHGQPSSGNSNGNNIWPNRSSWLFVTWHKWVPRYYFLRPTRFFPRLRSRMHTTKAGILHKALLTILLQESIVSCHITCSRCHSILSLSEAKSLREFESRHAPQLYCWGLMTILFRLTPPPSQIPPGLSRPHKLKMEVLMPPLITLSPHSDFSAIRYSPRCL